jgi:hypothetical protein
MSMSSNFFLGEQARVGEFWEDDQMYLIFFVTQKLPFKLRQI